MKKANIVILLIIIFTIFIPTVKIAQNNQIGTFYIDTQYNCNTFEGRNIEIKGWIMTSDPTSKMKIYIDGKDTKTDFSKRIERDDVIAGIPGYGGASLNPKPGFEANLDISTYTAGNHTVTYRLEQADGNVIYEENYQVMFNNKAKGTFDIETPNIYGRTPITKEAKIIVKGWTMSNDKKATMNIYIDGNKMETTPLKRMQRPDVIAAISGYGGKELNPEPGFETSIDITKVTQGVHKIVYQLETAEGEILAKKIANIEIKKGEFYIDTQYNCNTFEGRNIGIKGWIMTSDPTSKMKIYIDGQDTKTDFSKRIERADVIAGISGYGGASLNPKPGFEANLDISTYTAGNHTVTYRLEQADGNVIYEENYQVMFNNKAKGTFDIETPNIYGRTPITKEAKIIVKGWTMSNDKKATMNIYIDGNKMETTPLKRMQRPDVIAAISGYGGKELNPEPGFETSIDITKVTQGVHKIVYQLETAEGEILAKKIANIEIKKGEFYIDTQYNCNTFEGRNIGIKGWIMTSDPTSKMKIYIDGQDTKTDFSKRIERADVIAGISGYGGASLNPKPGFEANLDISTYTAGNHTVTYRLEQADGNVIYEENYKVNFDNVPRAMLDIDEPNWKGVPNKDGKIIGWVMTNVKKPRIRVYIDQYERWDNQYRVKRPDVLEAIHGYGSKENNPTPGFEIDMKYGDFALGTHTLRIVIEDEQGNQIAVKTREFTIYDNSDGIQNFPESYQIMLRKIVQEKGMTNWKFVPVYTGIDWNELTSTTNENKCLKNLVHESSPSTWKCSCGRYGDVEYVCASGRIVNYFLDPRNFLTQKAIFQFLDLSKTKVSIAQIQPNLTGTFLQDSVNGESYAKILYDAQNESGENAFSIMSRIFQEIGRGKPGNPPYMVSGKDKTYPNTYNFFNYGATDGAGNTLRGLKMADSFGWHTQRKALVDGAKLIAKDYIVNNKQNTKYLFKFDVTREGGLYNHQYMSNAQDPNSQASILFAAYNKGNLNTNLTFSIPVYNNMPAYVKLPSDLTGDLYYISSDYDSVGFRTGPGVGYAAVNGCERLAKDSVVKMIQKNINGWAKVEYDGKIGYVSEEYLTPVNTKKD